MFQEVLEGFKIDQKVQKSFIMFQNVLEDSNVFKNLPIYKSLGFS